MLRIRRSCLVLPAVLLFCHPGAARAQFPPDEAKNLKVLPADIPIRELIDTMASFTRALGVRCTYCHVGREDQPLSAYDFVSDEKPEKVKARVMLRMVAAINTEHLASLPARRDPPIAAACFTCHRGVAQPRPLQQLLLAAYDAGGVDSLESTYRSLRTKYYGRAAYDFGEVPLVDAANAIRARNRLPDAIRIYRLNVEVTPMSTFALRSLGNAQFVAGDTAAAVASFQRALAIDPSDAQSKAAIDRLMRRPLR